MSTAKEALLSRLLQSEGLNASGTKPASSLIQEVGGDSAPTPLVSEVLPTPPPQTTAPAAPVAVKPAPVDEGPSILEMMMAAQREANAEKEQTKAAEQTVASTKPLGAGFKKGFFGGGGKTESKKTEKKAPEKAQQKKNADVVEVKKAAEKKSNPLVFDDVQRAMEEDQHPLLKQLKQNDWITPDLTAQFQSNTVLSQGFRDPKCMAAMQLLQTNPKEAQAKYANDPAVSRFLQEFGKMMAGHFENLAAQQAGANSSGGASGASSGVGAGVGNAKSSSGVTDLSADGIRISAPSNSSSGTGTSAGIQEIGPLHAQVLQKKQQQATTTATSGSSSAGPSTAAAAATSSSKAMVPSTATSKSTGSTTSASTNSATDEDERVKQDEELRTMLMDPELQRILMECGDPAKFQQHMRNPDTYRKIVRLQKAGLVGTAR